MSKIKNQIKKQFSSFPTKDSLDLNSILIDSVCINGLNAVLKTTNGLATKAEPTFTTNIFQNWGKLVEKAKNHSDSQPHKPT